MKNLLLICSFLCLSFLAQAQNDSILILHYYQQDKGLMLKWLSTDFEVFQKGFNSGYDIYRSEVSIVNGIEKPLGYEKLNTAPIKPWNREKLETEIKKDSSFESALIFIEGTKEIINRPIPATPKEAVEEANSHEMMNLLTSFSVVNNNKVAEALGMYFLDKTVSPDKKYIYKIEVLKHDKLVNYLLVFPLKNNEKEKVMGLSAKLTPGAVYLRWYNNGNKSFPYYNIYRSEKKNGTYTKLNALPMVGTSGEAQVNSNISSFVDSIQQYNKTFYYKVIGVNAFEAEGTPSDLVEIKTFYMLTTPPVISDSKNPQGQDIEVQWAIAPEDKSFIKGFSVFRSESATGKYLKIHEGMLKSDKQSFLDKTEKSSSNYYIIAAYGAGGDSTTSLLHAHLLVDSIPPVKPVIVYGHCDTNGIITIRWAKNTEKDLLGYRVFKTDRLEGEPLRVISGTTTDTLLVDTVSLKRPYNKVYYRIAAVDNHFNPSVPSQYFEVLLPDINPPTNGNFKEYIVGMTGINLSWENSGAYDLKAMHILRKSDEEFEYKTLLVLSGDSLKITSFTDTTTHSFVSYSYTIQAEDESGLKSEPSKPMVVEQLDKRKINSVQGLRAVVSKENKMIKLSWDYTTAAKGFKIYRSRNGGPLETYEFVKGNKREYYDKWLKPKSTYSYKLVAELPGGYESGSSKKIEVKY